MGDRAKCKRLFPATAGSSVLAVVVAVFSIQWLRAQAPAGQSAAAKADRPSFDVASVRPNKSGSTNVNLGDLAQPGGLYTATNAPVRLLIAAAYNVLSEQKQTLLGAPAWTNSEGFDIEARAEGNPGIQEKRLMLQSLLADRFKLAVHFETRQLPVYALVLDKPGKLGARIRPHPGGSPCSTAPPPPGTPAASVPTVAEGFPERCGTVVGFPSPSAPGQMRLGGRDVPMEMIATSFASSLRLFNLDRPVLDRTGLSGTVDFFMEFTPQLGPLPPGSTLQLDPNGPTFIEALKDQLGLKLEPQTAPVDVLVIDHVEEPSPN